MIAAAFLIGGFGYMGLELLWRRRTHWSMGLAGGACTALLYALFTLYSFSIWEAYLASALVITCVELVFGYVFNCCLGMNVWDYSRSKFNLLGQICLPYTLMWGLLGTGVWGVTLMAG
ncbi:MAG: hypothetical protein Q4B99_04830 [Clostridia bacterium]|nr:hypothetical protein [Clostridia bacterium]